MSTVKYIRDEYGQVVPVMDLSGDTDSVAAQGILPSRSVTQSVGARPDLSSSGLTIARAESFPFQEFASANLRVASPGFSRGGPDIMVAPESFIPDSPVKSTSSQFSESVGASVSFAPNSATEGLSPPSSETRALLQQQESRNRPRFIA